MTDINAAVIKLTQETLGKYVKKPSLTEKLLKKPPFRFLYDVFSAVIRDTGYFEGLYAAEELNYDHIKDRNDKMKFLQKMIDVVRICTNVPLTVKTSKIVAGQEAEKTNELLQLMGKIIEDKLNWKPAVEQILKSKDQNILQVSADKPKDKSSKDKQSVSSTKSGGKTKQSSVDLKESKGNKRPKEKNNNPKEKLSGPKNKNNKPSKSEEKFLGESRDIKKIQLFTADSQDKTTGSEPETLKASKTTTPPTDSECDHVEQLRGQKQIRRPSDSDHSLDTFALSKTDGSRHDEVRGENKVQKPRSATASDTTILQDTATSQQSSSKSLARTSTADGQGAEINSDHAAQVGLQNTSSNKVGSPKLPDDVGSPEKQKEAAKSSNIPVEVKRESTFTRQQSSDPAGKDPHPNPTRTSLRPPSARPPSARPGAPRKRDRNIEIVLQPNNQIKMSGVQVKLETFGDLDDDGDNLVIIESANPDHISREADYGNNRNQSTSREGEDANQGHLVQQILETQKELTHQKNAQHFTKENDSEPGGLAMKQSPMQNMHSLREVIQNLTKSVNPLGKLMDFIPEDIDAMLLEFTMWCDAYIQAASQLKREKSLTESVTEPMKMQLVQIEASISEHLEIIDASRVKIIHNDEKILRMLAEGTK